MPTAPYRKKLIEVALPLDETTNPGDALGHLLRRFSPCLILVDEWVAYARQLHDDKDLPGGDFETQFTFAQTLTEEVKATPRAMHSVTSHKRRPIFIKTTPAIGMPLSPRSRNWRTTGQSC